MIRFFYDKELRNEHFVLNQLLKNSKYKNRFIAYQNQRIRKKDFILLTSNGTGIKNPESLFSNAISFKIEGFDFTKDLSFDYIIKISSSITMNSFNELLEEILASELQQTRRKISRNSKNTYVKFFKNLPESIKVSSYYKRKIAQFEQDWLDCKTVKDFYKKLDISITSFLPKKIYLTYLENILEDDLVDKYFLDFGSPDCYLVFTKDEILTTEAELIFTLIKRIKKYFLSLKDSTDGQVYSDKITESFQGISHPVVITDLKDNIIIYNKPFLALNLTSTDLKKISDQKSFKFLSNTYQIRYEKINDFKVFYFKLDTNIPFEAKDQDLGIISSSIAHELNNPIAAILAAIEVLRLDIDDPEKVVTLKEMSAGARRCQKLTQTFLGFSRNKTDERKEKFSEIFDRAYELVRFREIENNLKFKYKIGKELQEKKYFSSTMIMALYLILNSILLSYHRYTLVSQESISSIDTNISIKNGIIVFEFNPSIHLNPDLLKSKLLDFLLKEENLKLKFDSSIVSLAQI